MNAITFSKWGSFFDKNILKATLIIWVNGTKLFLDCEEQSASITVINVLIWINADLMASPTSDFWWGNDWAWFSSFLQLCEQTLRLTGSDEGRVQRFYPIGCHDDFNVSARVETIELVEQLQHGPLDLPLSSRVGVIPGNCRNIYLKTF